MDTGTGRSINAALQSQVARRSSTRWTFPKDGRLDATYIDIWT